MRKSFGLISDLRRKGKTAAFPTLLFNGKKGGGGGVREESAASPRESLRVLSRARRSDTWAGKKGKGVGYSIFATGVSSRRKGKVPADTRLFWEKKKKKKKGFLGGKEARCK